jgi:hypothetical protein
MATLTGRKLVDGLKPGLRVFISAGASGIGRAIADMLILHGARVHICDVSQAFWMTSGSSTHSTAQPWRTSPARLMWRACSRRSAPRSAGSKR